MDKCILGTGSVCPSLVFLTQSSSQTKYEIFTKVICEGYLSVTKSVTNFWNYFLTDIITDKPLPKYFSHTFYDIFNFKIYFI